MALKFFFFIVFWISINATPVQKISPRAEDYRLPEGAVKANNYNLELTLADNVFTSNEFSGILTLSFQALIATSEIKIHAGNLKFSEVKLTRTSTGQDVPLVGNAADLASDSLTAILTITATNNLVANAEYQLYFVYTAVLRAEEMNGLYKSTYTDENGVTQYLATTQFESTNARFALPCFDEPSYKATFEVKIRHPSRYNARSNTPGTPANENANTIVTTFQKTPIMPTYLLAFIISDFTCTNGDEIEAGIPYAVCSRSESASTRALAVDKGVKIMHALEELTGIKYSFSEIGKMDQYAIPDFAAGAMENWGIVTYRETGLLWDPEESANSYQQSIENVIAHEFAHMWFGNLITTHWWSDTFLNEGFARYYQYFATAVVEPTWELDKQFVVSQLQTVLVTDASSSAEALSSPASTPAEISGRFGTISYAKGGSVIRMIIHFLGEEHYKAGINQYLNDNLFGSAKPEDLWAALQPHATTLPAGVTLAAVMDAWIKKPGFPLLQVALNGKSVTISQERFLAAGNPDAADKWYVPITYTTSTQSDKFKDTSVKNWVLPTADLTIQNALGDDDSWIILNNQQSGYYRINYDDTLWGRIQTALNSPGFGGIHELNRAQIVDDFYNLARNGKQSYKKYLELLTYLRKDNSYYPWYATLNAFNNMLARTGNDKIRTALSTYILELLEIPYNSLPFQEAKDHNQIYTLNRAQIATWACRLGLADCVDSAVAAFKSYRNDDVKVDKNLRSVIYCNGLRYSDDVQNDWDALWTKYTTTKLATEQAILLTALGCAKDEAVLNQYLMKSITANSGIRSQDASSVFSAVYSGNLEGVDIAFQFFIKNYKLVNEYYTSMSSLNNLLNGIANRFTKKEQLDTLNQFLKTEGLPENIVLAGPNAIATAEANMAFIEAFEKELDLFFLTDESSGSSGLSLKISWITMILATFVMLNQV